MRRPVAVVPHTPWGPPPQLPALSGDQPRRVAWHALDDVLWALGPEGALSHLFLDGHLATLDDYLRAHPEAEPKLQSLAASGRLGLGPWVALADEHAVSAETIVHNLQAGLRAASQLGQHAVGVFLAPTWGHVAQMPQLLRQAGAQHVVVTAGPWPAGAQSAFWWRAPDGSSVRAEYRAVTGAARHGSPLEPAEEAVARLAAKVVEDLDALQQGPAALAPEEPLLWLHPTDLSEQGVMSLDRQAQSLAGLIEAVNSSQDRYFLQVGTLQDYLQGVSANGLMSVAGELRPRPAGAKSWEGLFSSRPDLAASAAAAERCLERLAEPLCALWLAPTSWPTEDLGLAWDQVVRNSDWRLNTPVPIGQPARGTGPFSYPTTERYAYAAKLAGDAARQALAAAASAVSRPGPLVVNPAPRPRSGLVQVRGTPTTELPWVQVVRGGRSLVWAEDVPGYGWAALRSLSRGSEEPDIAPVRSGPNNVAGPSLDNGLVHLSVSSAEGTYAINGHWGLGALVDSPLERPDGHLNGNRAEMDLLGRTGSEASGRVERPTSVQVEVVENGPLRGRLAVTRRYGWGSMEADVRTLLELRAGEPLVRVTVSFSNLRPGHQLSTVFPLAAHASRSLVNSPFATTERPSVPEASYPFRGFVCVGGLSALHDGLAEYAVVANGWALAITLLRSPRVPDGSTPYSEDRHGWEPWDPWESDEPGQGLFGAGPRARTWAAAAQLGHHVVRYALALGDPSAGPAGGLSPFELAEMAFVPLQVVQAQGVGQLPERGTHLAVTGAEISALRRVDGELELRAFNPTPGPVVVEVPGRRGALVDIQGETLATWEGSFALAPWSIATARIL